MPKIADTNHNRIAPLGSEDRAPATHTHCGELFQLPIATGVKTRRLWVNRTYGFTPALH